MRSGLVSARIVLARNFSLRPGTPVAAKTVLDHQDRDNINSSLV
jgi:hypothetical protein